MNTSDFQFDVEAQDLRVRDGFVPGASGYYGIRVHIPNSSERRYADIDWRDGRDEQMVRRLDDGFALGWKHNEVTRIGLEMLGKRMWNITGGGSTDGGVPAAAQSLAFDSTSRTGANDIRDLTQLTATDSRNELFDSTPSIDVSDLDEPFIDSTATVDNTKVDFDILTIAVTTLTADDTDIDTGTFDDYVYSALSDFTIDLTNVTTWTLTATYRALWQSA